MLSFVNEFKLLFHLDVVEILSAECVPFIFALQQHSGAAYQQAAGKDTLSLDIYVTLALHTNTRTHSRMVGTKRNDVHQHIVLFFQNFRLLASARWLCKYRKLQS